MMKPWGFKLLAICAVADIASTYAALLLVPGARELNPYVAPLLFTPLHAAREVASLALMALLYFLAAYLARIFHIGVEKGVRIANLASALLATVRAAAAANNLLGIALFFLR